MEDRFTKKYAVEDPTNNSIYLITVYSDQDNDWKIDHYESDLVTLIETYTPHDFLSIPKSLIGRILLEIGRAKENIAANKKAE